MTSRLFRIACVYTALGAVCSLLFAVFRGELAGQFDWPYPAGYGYGPTGPAGTAWEWQQSSSLGWHACRSEVIDAGTPRRTAAPLGWRQAPVPWWSISAEQPAPPSEWPAKHFVLDYGFGWPAPCLIYRELNEYRPATAQEIAKYGPGNIDGVVNQVVLRGTKLGTRFRADSIVWRGVATNALVLGLLLAVPQVCLRYFRAMRRAARRRAGRCPWCAYDRRGLAEGSRCPECGHHEPAPTTKRVGATGPVSAARMRVRDWLTKHRRGVRWIIIVSVYSMLGAVCAYAAAYLRGVFAGNFNGSMEVTFGYGPAGPAGTTWEWQRSSSLGRHYNRSYVIDPREPRRPVVPVGWREGPAPWWTVSAEQPAPPAGWASGNNIVIDYGFGWPVPCLCYRELYSKRQATPQEVALYGLTAGDDVTDQIVLKGTYLENRTRADSVLWRGLAVNALVFGLLLAAPHACVRCFCLIRAASRGRAVRCPWCGYQRRRLDRNARCPECGGVEPA